MEDHFGVEVSDPYRWLENGETPEVVAWIVAQNQRTRALLARTALVQPLEKRLRQLLEIGSVSLPDVRRTSGNQLRFFYRRREGQQNQPVLLWRDNAAGNDHTLVDVNQLAPDGTTSLDYFEPSPDGEWVAYGLSQDGSEDSTLYVRNVATGKDLADVITRTRYASVCWQHDAKGFYYTRYPAPGSVPPDEEHYHRRLYEHRIGQDVEQDQLVFGADREMTDFPSCSTSPNGRWLVVSLHIGWNKTDVYLADTKKRPLEFVEITQGKEHRYTTLLRDSTLWVMTNEGAPRNALYRVDPRKPARENWLQVLGEHPRDVLNHFNVLGGRLLAAYSNSGVSRLERFDLVGTSAGKVPLASIGTVDGISGVHDEAVAYFDFESFASPTSVHQLELSSGDSKPMLSVASPLSAKDFRVTQRTARSKDGTRVPYFLVSRRGVELNGGNHPTLLYGYGGFNISLRPRFSRTNYAFLERGGVFVQANLRGGGEFGEAWHRAGQRESKQNVFDDFFAVSEALIDAGVTSSERLAIYGRSNGGLLVAAAITQRPELYRAAVSAVPLTDMLRYPRFLLARLWLHEYGFPDKPRDFEWLYAYSPYHHVRPNTRYPATLFLTAESDTRVDPAHARKMAARMQAATSSPQPILLRTELKAGHGAGKPILKVAEEFADMYAFLAWQLGMNPAPVE